MTIHKELHPKDMNLFIGFDLGHGESCLMYVDAAGDEQPKPLRVCAGSGISFPTVLSRNEENILIGWDALAETEHNEFEICFKTSPGSVEAFSVNKQPLILFAQQAYRLARERVPRVDENQVQVVIGCPSGWQTNDIEEYRVTLAEAELPNLRVEKESRAAFIQAKDSKLIPPDKLNGLIVVIDIGSSTTDITHLKMRKVEDVRDGQHLGASLIDRLILEYNLKLRPEFVTRIEKNPIDRNIALLYCRRLKEKYYNYPATQDRAREVVPFEDVDWILAVNKQVMEALLDTPILKELHGYMVPEKLHGSSWKSAFAALLTEVKEALVEPPVFILLTGGASRMDFISEICQKKFPGTRLCVDSEPQTAVARGLACLARWEQRCTKFIAEVEKMSERDRLHELIKPDVPDLIVSLIQLSIASVLQKVVAEGVIDKWRLGEISAGEGLLRAFLSAGANWEGSEEARVVQNKASTQLIQNLLSKVKVELSEKYRKYGIERRPLRFSVELLTPAFAIALKEHEKDKFQSKVDKISGWIIDKILPDLILRFAKNVVNLAASTTPTIARKYASLMRRPLLKSFMLSKEFIDDVGQSVATSISEQMRIEFRAQVDEILVHIA